MAQYRTLPHYGLTLSLGPVGALSDELYRVVAGADPDELKRGCQDLVPLDEGRDQHQVAGIAGIRSDGRRGRCGSSSRCGRWGDGRSRGLHADGPAECITGKLVRKERVKALGRGSAGSAVMGYGHDTNSRIGDAQAAEELGHAPGLGTRSGLPQRPLDLGSNNDHGLRLALWVHRDR